MSTSQKGSDPHTADNGPGARIHRLRIERDMTQSALAGGKYSISYVSAVERGRTRPSLEMLSWCAQQLDVPITELLDDTAAITHDDSKVRQRMAKEAFEWLQAAQKLVAGDIAEALPDLRRLRQRAGMRAPAELIWLTAYALLSNGEADAALREAEIYNTQAQNNADARMQAAMHWLYGLIYAHNGQHQRAIEEYRAALNIAESNALPPDFRLSVQTAFVDTLLRQGQLAQAYALAGETIQAYELLANPQQSADQAAQAATAAAGASDFIQAYIFARWAYVSQREARARQEVARLYLRRALLANDAPASTDSMPDLERALLLATMSTDEQTAALVVACLVGKLIERGDLGEATQLVEAHFGVIGKADAATQQNPLVSIARTLALAYVAEGAGTHQEALTHARDAEAALAALKYTDLTNNYLALEQLFVSLGEYTQAIAAHKKAIPYPP